MVLFQSQEQKTEALCVIELDERFQGFDELIQRASKVVCGDTQIIKDGDFDDLEMKNEKNSYISDASLVKKKKEVNREAGILGGLPRSSSLKAGLSAGKSTLLNHLFRTKFREMDVFKGRSQTTKGIWMAKCADIEPCTLVMDLKGTDGRERGEDDTTFKKQSALFALAVSDIVLINMWCHDIGREQAANKPLLKTVFQMPMEALEHVLREDIEKVLSSKSIHQPENKGVDNRYIKPIEKAPQENLFSPILNSPYPNDYYMMLDTGLSATCSRANFFHKF